MLSVGLRPRRGGIWDDGRDFKVPRDLQAVFSVSNYHVLSCFVMFEARNAPSKCQIAKNGRFPRPLPS